MTSEELQQEFFNYLMKFNVDRTRTKSKDEFIHCITTNPFSLYFHFPFCTKACKCCVYGKTVNMELVDEYCECVLKEMALWSRDCSNEGKWPSTIYFGGGTPSLMPVKYLSKILETAHQNFPWPENIQITVEVNPGTADAAKMDAYKNAGVNRLSIGGQALHESVLQEMGRSHTPEQVVETIKLAQKKGFDFNVDLLVGFDCQTTAMVISDVKKLIDFGVPHISIQIMTPQSPQIDKKMIEKQREMHRESRKLLISEGYTPTTTEEFTKTKPNLYHHNIWGIPPSDVVAFGAYIFGNLGLEHYGNHTLKPYIDAIHNNEFPHIYAYKLSQEEEIQSRILFGLRDFRISRKKFIEEYKVDLIQLEIVNILKNLGLVAINDEYVQLVEEHFDFCLIWNLMYFTELYEVHKG